MLQAQPQPHYFFSPLEGEAHEDSRPDEVPDESTTVVRPSRVLTIGNFIELDDFQEEEERSLPVPLIRHDSAPLVRGEIYQGTNRLQVPINRINQIARISHHLNHNTVVKTLDYTHGGVPREITKKISDHLERSFEFFSRGRVNARVDKEIFLLRDEEREALEEDWMWLSWWVSHGLRTYDEPTLYIG